MWNPNTNVSEDCLYLNLWVPDSILRRAVSGNQPGASANDLGADLNYKPKGQEKNGSAVLVWIYGGAYMSGTSTLDVYDGDILSASEEIIVASLNYRVGALGFMCMGNDDFPCNQGMWDQVLALRWIKDNVAKFGGDPNLVSLPNNSVFIAYEDQ